MDKIYLLLQDDKSLAIVSSIATAIGAFGAVIAAIGAIIFWVYQIKINKRMLESSCISEVECILSTIYEFDDQPPTYKLFFRARWNSPVFLLFAFLWDQYFKLDYTLLWEDIIYSFGLLRIGDIPNIELCYKDNIGRYYKKSFTIEVKEWHLERVLNGSFKELIQEKVFLKVTKKYQDMQA